VLLQAAQRCLATLAQAVVQEGAWGLCLQDSCPEASAPVAAAAAVATAGEVARLLHRVQHQTQQQVQAVDAVLPVPAAAAAALLSGLAPHVPGWQQQQERAFEPRSLPLAVAAAAGLPRLRLLSCYLHGPYSANPGVTVRQEAAAAAAAAAAGGGAVLAALWLKLTGFALQLQHEQQVQQQGAHHMEAAAARQLLQVLNLAVTACPAAAPAAWVHQQSFLAVRANAADCPAAAAAGHLLLLHAVLLRCLTARACSC